MKKSRRPSRRRPPLNPLRAFAVSAKHLSFTLAAKEMCLSQDSVSRAVRSLENYFGFSRFERGVGTRILTNSGARYTESLGKAFSAIEDPTEALLDGRCHDTLTIQGYGAFLNRWLLPRLPEFQAKNLAIELRLISANDLVDFDERQIDVRIRYGSGNWPDHENILLFKDELRPVCSPRLLDPGKAPYDPEILSGQTLLRIKLNKDRWSDWFAAAGQPHMAGTKNVYSEDLTPVYQCAISGGFVLGRREHLAAEFEAGTLFEPCSKALNRKSGYYLSVHKNRAELLKDSTFIDWLRSAAEADAKQVVKERAPVLMSK